MAAYHWRNLTIFTHAYGREAAVLHETGQGRDTANGSTLCFEDRVEALDITAFE